VPSKGERDERSEVLDGKIIGAIGVSGATAVQDGKVTKAGADAAK
jgi:uncharacterized protein GlcG (DUF336 family)